MAQWWQVTCTIKGCKKGHYFQSEQECVDWLQNHLSVSTAEDHEEVRAFNECLGKELARAKQINAIRRLSEEEVSAWKQWEQDNQNVKKEEKPVVKNEKDKGEKKDRGDQRKFTPPPPPPQIAAKASPSSAEMSDAESDSDGSSMSPETMKKTLEGVANMAKKAQAGAQRMVELSSKSLKFFTMEEKYFGRVTDSLTAEVAKITKKLKRKT